MVVSVQYAFHAQTFEWWKRLECEPLTVKVKHDTKPLEMIHEDISSQPSYVDV